MPAPPDAPSRTHNAPLLLRSRLVLPVSQPPIENGAVLISGGRIEGVGTWPDFPDDQRSRGIDLGDSVLLPGLVNAHCHLDYTDMAGRVPPQRSFTDWLNLMLGAKAQWNYTEFAASWLQGANMLVRNGTTTVADFEAVPELLPEVRSATRLRVISLLEMTGVKSRRTAADVLQEAVRLIESLPGPAGQTGLAPHAPYSTVPELLRLSAATARERRWPFSIHLAESAEEFEMFQQAHGDMFDWLRRNGRDLSDCGLGSPVEHLERNGALTENLLAVHVNYLAEKDAALLGRRKVSVVHCPRSHDYFRHAPFPFRELAEARVNVCLGTDSLATVRKTGRGPLELNLFEEMRAFAAAHPQVPAKTILQMATMNGARALGLAGQAGEISTGAFADLIAIPFSGKKADAHQAILDHRGEVAVSLIEGQWARDPATS